MRVLAVIALLVSSFCPGAAAQELVFKVTYDGGSFSKYQPGERMMFDIYQGRLRILQEETTLLDAVPEAVLQVSYGDDLQQVGNSIGLSKASRGVPAYLSRPRAQRHFIGIVWNREGAKERAAFQVGKDSYQEAIAGLEGFTGKKALNTGVTASTR